MKYFFILFLLTSNLNGVKNTFKTTTDPWSFTVSLLDFSPETLQLIDKETLQEVNDNPNFSKKSALFSIISYFNQEGAQKIIKNIDIQLQTLHLVEICWTSSVFQSQKSLKDRFRVGFKIAYTQILKWANLKSDLSWNEFKNLPNTKKNISRLQIPVIAGFLAKHKLMERHIRK